MSLVAEEVWFRYGPRFPWVVEGVSLRVDPGTVVGLLGPSGTGKSTMGRILAGLLQPVRGRVAVDGTVPPHATGRPYPVQIVLQHPELGMNPRHPVRNILAEASASAEAVSRLDGVLLSPEWLDRFPHEISGGELQRVNVARALLADPAYLIADEITTGLDSITQARVWHGLLGVARARSVGVLAISHDEELLDRIADRVLRWDEAVLRPS